MKPQTKVWLIIAIILILAGSAVLTSVLAISNWDLSKFSTEKYETTVYDLQDDFSSILINADTADVVLTPAEDGKNKVICFESANEKHSVITENNVLSVTANQNKKWSDYIGINIESSKVIICLAKDSFDCLTISQITGDVEIPEGFTFEKIDINSVTGDALCAASATDKIKIGLGTGDIHIENSSADSIDLSVTTGKINGSSLTCKGVVSVSVSTGKTLLEDVTCESLLSKGSTGDITLKNVTANKEFSITRTTGDVRFESCDAAEIFVTADTGDVTGSLLSEKIFITQSDTGKITVPKSTEGGKCEITTSTGDIEFTIG